MSPSPEATLETPGCIGSSGCPNSFPLMDLPNEIILKVLWVAYGKDLERFVRANKRLWSLRNDALNAHLTIKPRYSTIDIGTGHTQTLDDLLIQIIDNPRIRHTITTLRIHDWRMRWPIRQGMPADYPWQLLETLIIKNTKRQELGSNARQKLLNGNESPILEVLIPLLPRLEILEINVSSRRSAWLRYALEISYRPSMPEIQHIRIYEPTQSLENKADMVHDLIHSHPKKSVAFENLRLHGEKPWTMRHQGWPNYITSLSLLNCKVSSTTVHSLLASLECIKTFSFIWEKYPDATIQPYFIVAGLEVGSKASLENLTILGCHHYSTPHVRASNAIEFNHLGSLRRFQNLKNVTIDAEMLMGDVDINCTSFPGEFLPLSILDLVLHVNAEDYYRSSRSSRLDHQLDQPHFDELKMLANLTLHGVQECRREALLESDAWKKMIADGINISWK